MKSQLIMLSKKYLKQFCVLFILCMVSFSMLWAQDEGGDVGIEDLIGLQEFIFGSLVTLIGYLSAKIPGINKIPSTWWKVASIGIAIGLGFWFFGANVKGLIIAFLAATNFYEAILKGIFGQKSLKAE